MLHAGVASTEEDEFESRKSEWPTEVRIGSSPIAHLFYFFCYVRNMKTDEEVSRIYKDFTNRICR